jgi:lipid-binding SYLF domain-containing protein
MRQVTFTIITMLWIGCGGAAPSKQSDRFALQDKAQATLQSMMSKDSSLRPTLDTAAGYAILPEVGKGGLIVGAAHGRGVLYQNHRAIGYVELSQASVGAQAGAQSYSELVVFQNQADVERVKDNAYTIGGNVSAVALTAGAGASTEFKNGVAVFVEPHGGVMAEVSISGQRLKFAEGG